MVFEWLIQHEKGCRPNMDDTDSSAPPLPSNPYEHLAFRHLASSSAHRHPLFLNTLLPCAGASTAAAAAAAPFFPPTFPFAAVAAFPTFLTTVVPVEVLDAALTVRLSFLATSIRGSAPLLARVIGAAFDFGPAAVVGAFAVFAAAARVRVALGFSLAIVADAAAFVATTAAALAGDGIFGGAKAALGFNGDVGWER